MGRAVGADEACAIEHETHRQPLDGDVVDDLVVGALQEGRIDRHKRFVALRSQSGRKRYAVLLGDADIEGASRECLLEDVDTGAGRHRGGNGNDAVVLLRLLDQALAEYLCVGRRVGLGFDLLAGRDVELDYAVIFVVGLLGRRITLALLGHDVDQNRAFFGIADVL